MQTRTSTKRSAAAEPAPLPSLRPPPARSTRATKRSLSTSTTTATIPATAATPATKRPKLSTGTATATATAVTAVNLSTVVDLATLDTYLGRLIPIVNGGQAKGGVVAALTGLLPPYAADDAAASSTHWPHPIQLPSFNRLSGYLRLHNALCLFINIPPHQPTTANPTTPPHHTRYPNLFTRRHHHTYFTWYAPSPVQPTHPLVHRLRNAAQPSTPSPPSPASPASLASAVSVLLFCRRVGVRGVGVEGYRYWGRVGYVSHDACVRPMPFLLELVDATRVEAVLRHDQAVLQQQADRADIDSADAA